MKIKKKCGVNFISTGTNVKGQSFQFRTGLKTEPKLNLHFSTLFPDFSNDAILHA